MNMTVTVTGTMMDITGPEFEAFQASQRIVPSESKARELALAERERAVARMELEVASGSVPGPIPETGTITGSVQAAAVQGGAWLAYQSDFADFRIYGTEIEALRYAVANSLVVKFLEFGENPRA